MPPTALSTASQPSIDWSTNDIPADAWTYTSIINACAQKGEVERAEEWPKRMEDKLPNHVDLIAMLGIADTERGVDVAGGCAAPCAPTLMRS